MDLLSVEVLERGTQACESCGHPIKQLFTIRLDTGSPLVVGCNCAESLLGKGPMEVMTGRLNTAVREWSKKTPKPLNDETREAYINRRISEKGNALKAWQAYQTRVRQLDPSYGLLHLAAERLLFERGIFRPVSFPHGKLG